MFSLFCFERNQKICLILRSALKFERCVCWPLYSPLHYTLHFIDPQRTTIPALDSQWQTQLIYSSIFSSHLRFFLLWSLLFFTDTNVSATDHATCTSNWYLWYVPKQLKPIISSAVVSWLIYDFAFNTSTQACKAPHTARALDIHLCGRYIVVKALSAACQLCRQCTHMHGFSRLSIKTWYINVWKHLV